MSIPASFFGIVLGLVGLGSNWRGAVRLWGMPPVIGEIIMAAAFAVWALLVVCYILKWVSQRQAAVAESQHPVQCCFIGLVPATTALMGVVLAPYNRDLANLALVIGGAGHVAFSVWRVGAMLQGDRDIAAITPVLYLPSVAGNFIVAITAGTLGYASWGVLFFGAGLFMWLMMESIIVNRLLHVAPLQPPLRPTLGIQLAPPVVAVTAWLANTQGVPETLMQAAWGYGIFQLLLLIRLLPWIFKQPFAPSYWAFAFGLTALSGGGIQMTLRGVKGAIAELTPVFFAFTNLALAAIIVGTLVLLLRRKLVPQTPTKIPGPTA
jgi:tellurite resistance protein